MNSSLSLPQFLGRSLLLLGLLILLLFLWQIAGILLLLFAGLLLAIFLRMLMHLLQRFLPLSDRIAFVIVLLALLVAGGALGWFFAPKLNRDLSALFTEIPTGLQAVREQLTNHGWANSLLDRISSVSQIMPSTGTLVARLRGTFSSVLDLVTNLIFVLFTGIFLAANPGFYRRGILQLVPQSRRTRAGEVLDEVIVTLRWWLVGQAIAMLIIGMLTGISLWFLGLPFALTLGIIAGLLEFVPYVGPVVTGGLAALLAFVQSPLQALYVLLLYIGIQQFESNLLTPIVHRYTVSLAPALSLTAVLIMGTLFGFIGVLVATPLVAVIVVLVKMLYIEDVLGETTELPRQLLK